MPCPLLPVNILIHIRAPYIFKQVYIYICTCILNSRSPRLRSWCHAVSVPLCKYTCVYNLYANYMKIQSYVHVYIYAHSYIHTCICTTHLFTDPFSFFLCGTIPHISLPLMWVNATKDNPMVMSYRVRSSLYIYMHIPLYTYMYIPLYISMHTPFICVHVYIAYTYIRFYVRTHSDEEYCCISLQGDRA